VSEDEEILARLAELKLNLETLQLHGHDLIDGSAGGDWVSALREMAEGGSAEKARRIFKLESEPAEQRPSTDSAQKFFAMGNLAAIAGETEKCELCDLSKTRNKVVFGAGDPNARLMFIGEAPGADEDRQGTPFVGRAGKLLTNMITAMGLDRDSVYIANILKCRPPANRNPEPDEIKACEPYLKRQVESIGPEIICALGAISAKTLLDTQTPISKLRGKFHTYKGIALAATYHPAYLLRNPGAKTEAWKDLQMIMERLGLPGPR